MSALEQSWPDPRHEELAEPQPSLMLKEAILKWYDVAPPDEPVPLAIRALARRCLRDAAKDGTLAVEDGLGFIVLRRCEGDAYLLHVASWRDENGLHEAVLAKGADDVLFRPSAAGEGGRISGLGAVSHEHEAWRRFLESARDDGAKRAYLRDCYSGLV